MTERVDIAVVGAGPGGIAAGVQAARRGVKHVVLERGRVAETVQRYQKGKWVMAEPERLPLQPELPIEFGAARREEVLARWERGVDAADVDLRAGPQFEVTAIAGERGGFALELQGGDTIEAGSVVLAIGTQGNLRTFGVDGDHLPHVAYQLDDPAEHAGRRVVVVGVGDAGLENALALAENGAEVSLVNRRDDFDRAKDRNRSLIETAIRRGDVGYHPNARVRRFEDGAVVLTTDSGELRLEADLVIGRLGAFPPRRFLESIGIELPSAAREAVPVVDESFESNVPGLHLIGAIVGRPLIKACLNAGFEVVERILGNPVERMDDVPLREILRPIGGDVDGIVERIRQRVPLFSSLTPIQLREFLMDSRVQTPHAGEVVYRRGDFSTTFYSILEGDVDVELPAAPTGADEGAPDARVVRLAQGDFFGEGSLIADRRRAGTVRARTPAILIETERRAISKLLKSETRVARVVDTTQVERRLRDLIPAMPDDERRQLADTAVLQTFEAGEVLFHEGDEADGLHFIRRGSVSILRTHQGHEKVINILPAGNYLGEIALVDPEGVRHATVRANVLTKTVRIPMEQVRPVLDRYPALRQEFQGRYLEAAADDQKRLASEGLGIIGFMAQEGGKEATDLLVIDESLCIRCDNCETACAETHGGVSRLDREGGPRFMNVHLPVACQHCENPHCMTDCPSDSIHRHSNGEVFIDDTCIGCGNCARYCPYGVIQMKAVSADRPPSLLLRILFGSRPAAPAAEGEGEKVAVKCDLCRNLPDRRARCVASCPTGAIARVHPEVFTRTFIQQRS